MPDTYTSRGELLDLLRARPHGLTAKQIAAELHARESTTSSRLSKLADYGLVTRIPIPDRHGTKYLYRLLPQVAARETA